VSEADNTTFNGDESAMIAKLQEAAARVRQELGRVIVGQAEVIDQLLIALFAKGHCILEGVPGLAKTLMVSSLAQTLSLSFNRIQFTPDLMPADITGTEVIQEDRDSGERVFKFLKGPVFANLILADEVNRTPPKTQAALLEAMQERQVTIGGVRHVLPDPFFVLATQNPIEQEGTYPLPEAQQDRFMFKVFVDYPNLADEVEIVRRTTAADAPRTQPVLSAEDIRRLQALVRRVPVSDAVIDYAARIVRASRVARAESLKSIADYVAWGAGPRATQYLILGAKARAILTGSPSVGVGDVQAVALPVLRHRVITNFNAESEGVTSDVLVRRLLESVPPFSGAVVADKRTAVVLR
jgi:MoxR-like ATPase